VNDQRARVADIGDMREQLHVGHELDARFITAAQSEGENGGNARRSRLQFPSLLKWLKLLLSGILAARKPFNRPEIEKLHGQLILFSSPGC
jgi:hypothetical protein